MSRLAGDIRQLATGFRWGHKGISPLSAQLPDRAEGSRRFPTDWARAPWARAAREVVLRYGFAPLLKREVRARIEGLELLDELRPPVIFIANHSSHLDAPMILTSLPLEWQRRTAVGAAADYFFDAWWRAAGTTLAFNAFPVERTGARGVATARRYDSGAPEVANPRNQTGAKKTAGVGNRLIREGWNLLMFPEGTRSKDGWLGEFKHGTAALAIDAQAPVIPIALRGNYQAMPRGQGWPAPGRPPVSLRIGRPIYPKENEQAPAFTVRMQSALEQTIHEDVTDWWTSMKLSGPRPESSPPNWRRQWESSRPLQDPDSNKVWR